MVPSGVAGTSTSSTPKPASMVRATRRQRGLSVAGSSTLCLRRALTASTSASPSAVEPSYMLALETGSAVRRLM